MLLQLKLKLIVKKDLIQIEYTKYDSIDGGFQLYIRNYGNRLWESQAITPILLTRKFHCGSSDRIRRRTKSSQEPIKKNASFPAGLCAERTAMYRAGIPSNPPKKNPEKFKRIAIAAIGGIQIN